MGKTYFNPSTGRQSTVAPKSSSTSAGVKGASNSGSNGNYYLVEVPLVEEGSKEEQSFKNLQGSTGQETAKNVIESGRQLYSQSKETSKISPLTYQETVQVAQKLNKQMPENKINAVPVPQSESERKLKGADIKAGVQLAEATGSGKLALFGATGGKLGLPFALNREEDVRGDILYKGKHYTTVEEGNKVYTIESGREIKESEKSAIKKQLKNASKSYLNELGVVDIINEGKKTSKGKYIISQDLFNENYYNSPIEETNKITSENSFDYGFSSLEGGYSKDLNLQQTKLGTTKDIIASKLLMPINQMNTSEMPKDVRQLKESELFGATYQLKGKPEKVTGKIEKSEKSTSWWEQTQYEVENQKGEKGFKDIAFGSAFVVGAYGYGRAKGFVEGATYPFRRREKIFTEDIPSIATEFEKFIKGEETALSNLGAEIYFNPIKGAQIVGEFQGFGKGQDFLFEKGKSGYIKIGSKYIPKEEVFAESVISGKELMPTTKSIKESLSRFEKFDKNGNIVVSSASPKKISGNIAGSSRKGELELEDPGIYVTPKGEGSPAFLRINKEESAYFGQDLSISDIDPLGYFKVPTVTEFEVAGVKLQPREVVSQPGFKATKKFFEEEGSKTGYAYITKRSEIGLGNIEPQFYELPGSFRELETGKIHWTGTKFKEMGTSEIEAVIPFGAKFEYSVKSFIGKLKGFDEYTVFEGKTVAIRKTKVIKGGKVQQIGKSLTTEYLLKEQDYLISSLEGRRKNSLSKIRSNSNIRKSEISSSRSIEKLQSEILNDISSSRVSSRMKEERYFDISKYNKSSSYSIPSRKSKAKSKIESSSSNTKEIEKLRSEISRDFSKSEFKGSSVKKGRSNISSGISVKIPKITILKNIMRKENKGRRQIRKNKKEKIENVYVSDFSSKFLDIGIEKTSNKELNKLLKGTYSGIEFRKVIPI